jgi:molecular chaperone GrpE
MFGLGSMEKRLSEKIEEFGKKIETYLADHTDSRLDSLDERFQQVVRQERRNQAAFESLFENQRTELSILRGIRNESKALKALMAFAESFALWRQSQPDSPEFQVLRAKLADILDLYGLDILADVGVPFDPSIHEACAVRFDPYEPEGSVLEIVRPGFASGGEILRCASVVINRFPVVAENETEDVTDGEDDEFVEEEAEIDDRIGV